MKDKIGISRVVFLLIIMVALNLSAQVLEQDSLALVVLYNSTNGASWTNNDNWLSGSVSSWYGVTVSDGRVTEIDLQSNNLTGKIPPEIGEFDSLQVLDFFNNQLTDTIPNEIYNLTKLTRLSLRTNQLTSAISPWIGNLVNLENLWLAQNQLTDSIPDEIYDLIHLEVLMLFSNQLTGTIPSDINNLVNLQKLDLSGNQLTGEIPSEIGYLINLEILNLSQNQLTDSMPTEIGQLTNLQSLWLGNNQLIGNIPIEIGDLINLNSLRLNDNQLSDTIPSSIWNLVNLTDLYLNYNQLEGSISSQVLNLTKLHYFYIQFNELIDLPNLSSITTLTDVSISGNRFTFEDIEPNVTIPNFSYWYQDSVGAAQDTTVVEGTSLTLSISVGGANNQYQWIKDGFAVSGAVNSDYTINPVNNVDAGIYTCDITNTVATALTLHSRPIQVHVVSTGIEQDSLALVALYNNTGGDAWANNLNWLSGPVATWYGLTVTGDRVTRIELQDNNLVGEISSEIGNLTYLTYLSFDNNQLSGSIPPEIGNLIYLEILYIGQNQLTGPLPPEIGNLTNLEILNLWNNQLSDSIPPEIGNLTSLEDINLNINQLTGRIPSEIGNLVNLRELKMNNNQLEGPLPPDIGNCTQFEFIDLNHNLISGAIPDEIGNLTNITYLNLNSNQFSDSIPESVGNLSSISRLVLGNNQLTGSIPEEIGNCSTLKKLQLSDNQLDGSLPSEIGNLVLLEELFINYNQLSGPVPEEITNLVNLKYLILDHNQFTDLPDLSSISTLSYLYAHNNRLTFEDIEPNLSIPELDYSPQDSIGEKQDIIGYSGFGLTLSVDVGGANNVYQWFKDNSSIPGAMADDYTIPFVAKTDSGTYYCQITNTQAIELTLFSRPIHVTVDTLSGFEKDSLALVAFYDSTGGSSWTNHDNWLSGPLDTWYGIDVEDGRVTDISLSDNHLNGHIPVEIGNLDSLEFLYLHENMLSDTIPSEIGNCRRLRILYLNSNQLNGSIPPEIGNLSRLTSLYLNYNELEGSIPSEIGNLSQLTHCYLNGNQLTEDIPSEIGNLTNLEHLSLQNNLLMNSIPSELGLLSSLKTLNLTSNQLTGTIPASLGNLTSLTILEFGYNQLTGSIPVTIGNLTKLTVFRANNNNLSETLPDEIWNLTNLNALRLEQNDLEGIISGDIVNLTALGLLWLYGNEFSDLPDVSSIPGLTDLRIQDNRFTFEDIEPNIGIANFTYSPQDSIGEKQDTTITESETLALSVNVGGTANQYQWYQNSSAIGGADSSTYMIETVALSDSGSYTCRITNTIATELTLYARPIMVHVAPGVGVAGREDAVPEKFNLLQNYPNPFNPETKIEYHLPEPSEVKLVIYDVKGQIVRQLIQGVKQAGCHNAIWDSRNSQGQKVATGIYIYRIEIKSKGAEEQQFVDVKKMVLMK